MNAGMTYRTAEASEESAILEVFRRVFGVERGAERWAWQYRRSPAGPGIVGVADTGGRIVGCLTLMRQDLNVAGTRLPAAQACDGMMEAEFRKGGHFAALGHANDETGAAIGLGVIIGFPNQQSFPTMVRHLGHHRVLVLKHYYRRLGARRLLGAADIALRPLVRTRDFANLSLLRFRRGERLQMDVTRDVPEGVDAFLSAARRLEVLSIWKDAAYLRWRYAEHPENRYDFVALRREGEIQALAVMRRMDTGVAICELMQKDRDPRLGAVLLHRLALRAGDDPRCQIIEFYGSDISFFDAAFMEAGWSSSPHSLFTMTAKHVAPGPAERLVPFAANWQISYGDTDVV